MDDLELLRLLRSRDQRGWISCWSGMARCCAISCAQSWTTRENGRSVCLMWPSRYGRGQTSSTRSGVL